MAQSFADMIVRLKKGDIPSTPEFAKDLEELQQQMRAQTPGINVTVSRISEAEARVFLVGMLKHLEQRELPKLISTIELLRRQLSMPTMLFKRMGDYL